jgi:AraC family transcriptional regulator, transcriptional activator of pobA
MKNIVHISTIDEYNRIARQTTLHPLVSVIDFSNSEPGKRDITIQALTFGFYSVFLKYGKHCNIRYGRNYYDYQDGTLVFIGPNQVTSIEEDEEEYQPSGFVLLFHPDLIRGTSLAQNMKDYSFFSYDVHEALHLSDQEKEIVLECFRKIGYELQRPLDKHSRKLIVSNIELFLNYCIRFYDRQFITREVVNLGLIQKLETLLDDYFKSEKPQALGIPYVTYCADQLNLSANYFGDLVKRETGKSAQEYIQLKIVNLAKDRMADPTKSLSEIAYDLGFKYPQHFTRFFKQKEGITPNEYRSSFN